MSDVLEELDHDSLRRKFSAQFEAAESVLADAWNSRPTGSAGPEQYRSLIFAIFARATLTYRAVLHLCRVDTPSRRTC